MNTTYLPLSELPNHQVFSPSFLSQLLLNLILPAKLGTHIDWREHFFKPNLDFQAYQKIITISHDFEYMYINGLETTTAISKENSKEYQIFFCGNGQNAMHIYSSYNAIKNNPNINHILFNYPGVNHSDAPLTSTHDILESGYTQAMHLINKGVQAQNITLHGHSLGGSVALYAARKLYDKGYHVKLKIDRSFATISSVIPENIQLTLNTQKPIKKSMISSGVTCALYGLTLGINIATIILNLGKLISSIVCLPNYLIMSKNGPLEIIGKFIETSFNVIGSFIGGIIAVAGLITGGMLGMLLGILLSVQSLWTKTPYLLDMNFAAHLLCLSAFCEIDSIQQMNQLLEHNPNHNDIELINTINDEIIPIKSSLSYNLGFLPSENKPHKNHQRLSCQWYSRGGHCEDLQAPINPLIASSSI
jgi:hypothetical protein